MNFHRVILSSDDNPQTLEAWPFVASAWNTWFPEISLELAYLTRRDQNDPLVKHMFNFGNIHMFNVTEKLDNVNSSCVLNSLKYIVAAMIGDESHCLISDMKYFPLNREGYKNMTDKFIDNRVLISNNEEVMVKSNYLRSVINKENKTPLDLMNDLLQRCSDPETLFKSFISDGVKVNSVITPMNTIDMTKSGVIKMSDLWQYKYDRCSVPPVPYSLIQEQLKILIDFVGTNEVKFEGVDKKPKPHWVGVTEPSR